MAEHTDTNEEKKRQEEAGKAAAEAKDTPPAEEPEHELEGPGAAEELQEFSDRAYEIRKAHDYAGELTLELYQDLEPLLREPLPDRYIETTPPTQGKPYVSTGVKSAQVQIDRLNAVLGAAHWRALPHYEEAGKRCRVWVIIGNHLEWARLDERGELEPYTVLPIGVESHGTLKEATILVSRDGYGGHGRGSAPGDLFKGSETNALKRVVARIGPGCDVYRQDYDEDTHAAKPSYEEPSSGGGRQRGPSRARGQAQARQAPAQAPAAEETPEELQAELERLTADKSIPAEDLELRDKARVMMGNLGVSVGRQVQELHAAKGKRGLESLIKRLENAAGRDATPPAEPSE